VVILRDTPMMDGVFLPMQHEDRDEIMEFSRWTAGSKNFDKEE
jgi:hypothetical protein